MKKLLALLVLVLAAVGVYWFVFRNASASGEDHKLAAITLKKHSEAFNKSVDATVNTYLALKDAFVEGDTAKAKQQAGIFINMLDSLPVSDLKNDSSLVVESVKASIADIRSNAVSLLAQTDITEMRQDFNMITAMLYPGFFKAINYEGPKLYLQHCPMAFGEDKGADWISNSEEVVNPYLGKTHPQYKDEMLHCGEVKDTIKAQ
ncbi:MAG: DUF3347 domain-containing protein [Ferruginibacter sp.]